MPKSAWPWSSAMAPIRTRPSCRTRANDASAMAALFKNAGFDVVEARQDLGNLDFKRAVRDFTAATRDADIAVIYYAGHGIEIGGINYHVAGRRQAGERFRRRGRGALARPADPGARAGQAIAAGHSRCLPRQSVCPDHAAHGFATRQVSSGLAKVEPTSSDTLIAFAAKAGSTADGRRRRQFAIHHGSHQAYRVPGLDVRIAFGRVRDEVLKSTGNKQEPFVYGSLGGSTVTLVPRIAKPSRSRSAAAVVRKKFAATTNSPNASAPRRPGIRFCRGIRPVSMPISPARSASSLVVRPK